MAGSLFKPEATTPHPITLNTTSSLTDQTAACQFNVNNFKQQRRTKDSQKKDLISIEDEIYNLAFRPARRPGKSRKIKPRDLTDISLNMTRNVTNDYFTFEGNRLYEEFYDMNANLVNLVKQDLFIEKNEVS